MKRSALVVILVGCGGGSGTNVQPTLVFADRSDAEISRLISAAGGGDMFSAQAQIDQFSDSMRNDPCPAIAASGDTVMLTGGCTTKDGVAITGSATLINPTAWDPLVAPQFGVDTVYQYDLAFAQSGFTQSFSGTMQISGSFTSWDAQLDSTLLGIGVTSDLTYECSQGAQACDLVNSGVELDGVGGALVSGTVHVNNTGSAEFTLQGVDRLTAQLTQGCVAWQIDGTGRQKTCP